MEACEEEENVPNKLGEVLVLETGRELGTWSQKREKEGWIR